jgi:hypothetical protein
MPQTRIVDPGFVERRRREFEAGGPPSAVGGGEGGVPLPAGQFADYFGANIGRIPGGVGLESESSKRIMELLNPPSLFPDTSRRAAELTAGRGIAGSPAAFGTGLRMTDDERLRRIALGEQFLSAAYSRQPAIGPEYTALTPYQREQLDLEKKQLELERERAERALALQERESGYGPAMRGPQYTGPAGVGYGPGGWGGMPYYGYPGFPGR